MTTVFRIEDSGLLAVLENGDKVAFNVDDTAAGFSITHIVAQPGSYDTIGLIKQIELSEGKIIIEHGPIERLGMPATTMVFIINDPEVLPRLERGMQVEFDVFKGSGGFEVTRIKPVASAKAEVVASESFSCYTIGPFKNRARALAVSARYRAQGASTSLRSSSKRVLLGTRVYIDSHESREAALATAETLESRGISDYLIISEPGKLNAISLGVFGQEQNAVRLKNRVEAMNYAVKTESRYRRQTFFWLHNEQSVATETLKLLAAEEVASGIGQVARNCPTGEDAGLYQTGITPTEWQSRTLSSDGSARVLSSFRLPRGCRFT